MEFDVTRSQLFLDDAIVEQSVRLQRVIHQPVKYYGNPVYTVGAPWEGTGVIYLGGVHIDPADGLWKAWYVTLYPPEYPEITFAICMIVSDDGFSWRRPELDVFRGHDGEWTNIVLDLGPVGGTTAPCILYEPENDPEPWTMLISSCGHEGDTYRGYILHSKDGVHWRWEREFPDGVLHGFNDRTTGMKGPDPDFPYVFIGRGSDDMYRWGLPRSAHRVDVNAETAKGEPTRVIVPDLEDDPAGQIYHAFGFPYEDIYVGMFQWYWETNDPYGEMELLVSRDTVAWNRVCPRKPFLPRTPGGGTVGAFDAQITDIAVCPPIRTERPCMEVSQMDTLWFYYWGGPAMHGNRHLTFGRGMGLAQLRADGFCSLRAERFAGKLFTKPFIWPGGDLLINSSVLGGSGAGGVRAEVLTEDLEPIEGLTEHDADGLHVDGVRQVQKWNGDPRAIDKVRGQRVRFKFHIDNADLYSFRASE